MGATQRFGLPYPEESDTPDVPRDIKALAEAVDARLGVNPTFPQIMLSKKTETDLQPHGWRNLPFPDLHQPSANTHPAFFGQSTAMGGGVLIKKGGLYLTEFQGKLSYGGGTDMQWKAIFNLFVAGPGGQGAEGQGAEVLAQQAGIMPHTLGLVIAHMSSINWLAPNYVVGAGAYTYFGSPIRHAVHAWDYPSYLRVTYLGPVPTGLPDPTEPVQPGQQSTQTPE